MLIEDAPAGGLLAADNLSVREDPELVDVCGLRSDRNSDPTVQFSWRPPSRSIADRGWERRGVVGQMILAEEKS